MMTPRLKFVTWVIWYGLMGTLLIGYASGMPFTQWLWFPVEAILLFAIIAAVEHKVWQWLGLSMLRLGKGEVRRKRSS